MSPPRSKNSPIRNTVDWLQKAYLLYTGSGDQQEWHDKEKKGPSVVTFGYGYLFFVTLTIMLHISIPVFFLVSSPFYF